MRVFNIFKKCEAILKDVVLLLSTNSFSFGILWLKNLDSRAQLFKNLPRQSKIHEQSIHSTSTKTIIETSREYFSISIYSRKHQASFYSVNVLVLHKLWSHKFFTHSHFSQFPGVVATYKQKQICFLAYGG